MTCYDRLIFLKQFSHLGLGQPNGFILQADVYLRLPVFALIYDYFVFFHLALEWFLLDFLEGAGDGVDDEAADGDVAGHQRVRLDGGDGLAH